MQLTLKQISDALRISRPRIEQWISRGYFRPPQEPILGVAREWEVVDAIRLSLMAEMLDAGMSPQEAGALVYIDPNRTHGDDDFFVAWRGYHTFKGSSDALEDEPLKILMDHVWRNDVVRGGELADFLSNPDVISSRVVSLVNLERRVNEALAELA